MHSNRPINWLKGMILQNLLNEFYSSVHILDLGTERSLEHIDYLKEMVFMQYLMCKSTVTPIISSSL